MWAGGQVVWDEVAPAGHAGSSWLRTRSQYCYASSRENTVKSGWLQIWDLIWFDQIQDLIQDYYAEIDTVALSLGKTAGKCNQCKVAPKIWWYRVTGGLIDRALLRCTQRVLCARWIILVVLTTYSHSLSLAGDFQSNVRKIKDKGYQWVAQSNGLRKKLFEIVDRWSIE